MKLERSLIVVFIVLTLVASMGCAAVETKDDVQKVYRPAWWNMQDPASDYINIYGFGTATYEESAMDIAKSNAWANAAGHVKSYVDAMMKRYLKESGVENSQVLQSSEKAIKVVTSAEFSGVMMVNSEMITDNGQFKSFVVFALPKADIDKKALDAIKNEEALYTEFKASQAFKELEESVENKSK